MRIPPEIAVVSTPRSGEILSQPRSILISAKSSAGVIFVLILRSLYWKMVLFDLVAAHSWLGQNSVHSTDGVPDTINNANLQGNP